MLTEPGAVPDHCNQAMRILLLCEGNAEDVVASSGYAKSLLDALRAAGHEVHTGDVDLHGSFRWAAAARMFSPRRRRWAVRYHTGDFPFQLRSRNAATAVRRVGKPLDAILQIGATFAPEGRGAVPYFQYCDSSMRMSADAGHSWAGALRARELESVIARERRVYDGAAAIFTFSEFVRQSFVTQVGVAADKVVASYVGPNLDLTTVQPRDTRRPDAPPTVLFVGKEFERKGGDVLLAAFRRVRERIADARLTIIGPPDLRIDDPGVTSLGFLRKDDPASLRLLTEAYASADVFCLPTRYEPFGIVILEAMFHGLPCVATRDWSIPEMIRDGETGFTVPVGDDGTLADRLLSLLSDPARARAMGDAGLAHARERFTWPNVAKRISAEMERRIALQAAGTRPSGRTPIAAGGPA